MLQVGFNDDGQQKLLDAARDEMVRADSHKLRRENPATCPRKVFTGFFPGSSNILMKDMCDDTHILF